MNKLLMTLGLLASLQAHAEIFVCEVDGQKTYSQQPCGTDAKPVTLNSGVRQVTLKEPINRPFAEKVCSLMSGAWDMSASASRVQGKGRIDRETHAFTKDNTPVDPDAMQRQVMNYLRERIANYNELNRTSPYFVQALTQTATLFVSMARRNPNVTSEAVREFEAQCVPRFLNAAEYAARMRR